MSTPEDPRSNTVPPNPGSACRATLPFELDMAADDEALIDAADVPMLSRPFAESARPAPPTVVSCRAANLAVPDATSTTASLSDSTSK